MVADIYRDADLSCQDRPIVPKYTDFCQSQFKMVETAANKNEWKAKDCMNRRGGEAVFNKSKRVI